MKSIKKLYGCINTRTGEIIPKFTASGNRYAYKSKNTADCAFFTLLQSSPTYQIVELIPRYLEEEQVCHAQ